MVERPYAYDDMQTKLLTHFYEASEIIVTRPNKVPLRRLMDIPKHISGNYCDSTRFHFQQLLLPLRMRVAAVVEFSHDGNERDSVAHEIKTVGCYLLSLWTECRQR